MSSNDSCSRSLTSLGKRPSSIADLALIHPAHRLKLQPHSHQTCYPHSTPLFAHHSCVNALAVSSGAGEWLATGGDDKRILLWRATGDLAKEQPRATYRGARANIFSIAFTSDNTKILSGGADYTVLMHDMETATNKVASTSTNTKSIPPSDAWGHHQDAVHRVRCHPTNPNLFMSASDDGTVASYDLRVEGGLVDGLSHRAEMADVAYHPQNPDTIFATGDSRGGLYLHDSRKAFTESLSELSDRAVQEFHTSLSRVLPGSTRRPNQRASPSVSSISFSPTGSLLSATLTGHLPTFYELSSPYPLFNTSCPAPRNTKTPVADTLPGYRNGVTTKHGGFGGGSKYAEGSDDFRVYVWDIPETPQAFDLLRQKRTILGTEDPLDPVDDQPIIAYHSSSSSSQRTIVPSLSTPSSILTPHRSIVNSCLFHPTLPLLFTSGVEKLVWAHSQYPFAPSVSRVPRARRAPHPAISLFGLIDRSMLTRRDNDQESKMEKELRLRSEDGEVLDYFDALMVRDRDIWREHAEADDNSSDEMETEDGENDDGGDEEDDHDYDDQHGDLGGLLSIFAQDSDSGVESEDYP